MNINDLEIFTLVAELGSFAEAARQRGLDPSQVSRSISGLESDLGFQLFKRTTRSLALTESGQHYLQRIIPVMEELAFANEEALQINTLPSGTVRITASTAFGQICILPLLQEFHLRYPQITLELILSDQNLDLIRDNIDIACRLSPTLDSTLVGVKLFDTHYQVCATPEYLNKNNNIKYPLDIGLHQCIVLNLRRYRSRWHFLDSNKHIHEIKIQSRLAVSNALALREAIIQSLGPGLVANWLVKKETQNGNLIDLFPEYRVTATDFNTSAWLLYPSRKYLPQKDRVVIDFLKEKLHHYR